MSTRLSGKRPRGAGCSLRADLAIETARGLGRSLPSRASCAGIDHGPNYRPDIKLPLATLGRRWKRTGGGGPATIACPKLLSTSGSTGEAPRMVRGAVALKP